MQDRFFINTYLHLIDLFFCILLSLGDFGPRQFSYIIIMCKILTFDRKVVETQLFYILSVSHYIFNNMPYFLETCDAGSYKNDSGCFQCLIGTWSPANASSCTNCNDGRMSPPGSTTEEDCIGMYHPPPPPYTQSLEL